MLDTTTAFTRHSSHPAMRVMFEARKRVFVDILGWNVPVLDGRYEIDQFDTEEAVYIVLTDDAGNHRASTRLLRTAGPHILGALFPVLCEDDVPTGTELREITRFCIEPTLPGSERRLARNELVTAVAEHALRKGIAGYTAVATRPWFRQISRFGWCCRALGPGQKIGDEDLVALRIDIESNTLVKLRGGGVYRNAPFRILEAEAEFVS